MCRAALCGSVGEGAEQVFQHGITAVFSAIGEVCDFAQVKKNCARDLRLLSDSVMRLLAAGNMAQNWKPGVPLVLDRKLAGSGFREKWAQRAEFGCMQPAGISQPDRNITTERKEAR
ncbi:MAG: glycerate kinase [Ruthenibacterium sp.]